jgi:hypothetical protein
MRAGRNHDSTMAAIARVSAIIASNASDGSTRPIIAGWAMWVSVAALNNSAPGWTLLWAMPFSWSSATCRVMRNASARAPSTWRSTSASWAPNLGSSMNSENRSSEPVLVSRMTLCSVVIIPRRTFFRVGR